MAAIFLAASPAPGDARILGQPLEVLTREIEGPTDPSAVLGLRSAEAVRPPRVALDGMDFRLQTSEGSSNRSLPRLYTPIRLSWSKSRNNDLNRPSRCPSPVKSPAP